MLPSPDDYVAMLDRAAAGRYAFPAINVTSSQTLNAAMRGFAEAGSDGIVQVTVGGARYLSGAARDGLTGARAFAALGWALAGRYPVAIALHTDDCAPADADSFLWPLLADSGERVERRERPLFHSHMFDGSTLPLGENLRLSAALLDRCRELDIVLEVECGVVGTKPLPQAPAGRPRSVSALFTSVGRPMEAYAHHEHHELPTSGRALDALALSATLHCLTGCAIGEVTGMIIGTALGWSDWGTVALAVALAFLFGYTLTSLPLLRGGLALSAVVPIALASDTLSIGIMEVVDNAIMLAIPGAMEAGLDNELFWGSLSVALAVAGFAAFPANRWLLKRGKGHAAVHETGIHGGPSPRVVGTIAVLAASFGTVVLVAEALG